MPKVSFPLSGFRESDSPFALRDFAGTRASSDFVKDAYNFASILTDSEVSGESISNRGLGRAEALSI